MATSTERFGFTKPAGSDPASVVPLNSNTDLIELYLGRTQDSIAPMYDDTETYSVGDLRTYESRLYKCNTDISTPETFDPEKWDLTTAVQEGGGGTGAGIEYKTPAEYNALTPEQKNNGSTYVVQYSGTSTEQLIDRVSESDNKISVSGIDGTGYGWYAFDGVTPADLRDPQSGCWKADQNNVNPWIKYHFDEPKSMSSIKINAFSNYDGDYSGNIYVEGSNDDSTWVNLIDGATSFEASAKLQEITENEITLDDSTAYEYIRVRGSQAFNVYYSPSFFVDEIYVYGEVTLSAYIQVYHMSELVFDSRNGGTGAGAIEITSEEYEALSQTEKENGTIYFVHDTAGTRTVTGTFITGAEQYSKVEVDCGLKPTKIDVVLPFSNGDTYASYDEDVSDTTSTWRIPMEGNTYTIILGSETGETGITDILDNGFKFRCNAGNTRNVACTYEVTGIASNEVTKIYYMGTEYSTGGSGGSSEAEDINYDNTTSQLTADNVQDAIDEVVANAETASEDILTLQNVQGYDAYDETQTYAVGDYAIYNNHVYECTTAVSTAEPFDASKWSETSIEQIIDGVKGDVSQLNSSLTNKQDKAWTKIFDKSYTTDFATGTGAGKTITWSNDIFNYSEMVVLIKVDSYQTTLHLPRPLFNSTNNVIDIDYNNRQYVYTFHFQLSTGTRAFITNPYKAGFTDSQTKVVQIYVR